MIFVIEMHNSEVDRLLDQFTLRRHVSSFFEQRVTNSVFRRGIW
jgi:hypothetical protein